VVLNSFQFKITTKKQVYVHTYVILARRWGWGAKREHAARRAHLTGHGIGEGKLARRAWRAQRVPYALRGTSWRDSRRRAQVFNNIVFRNEIS